MKIVRLSVATSDRWKDKNTGEQRDKTEWHRVVIFNENIGNWIVSEGTDFSYMFCGAYAFDQDIGDWDVSSGISFEKMLSDMCLDL